MDSGNSGSIQSSSGAEEECDSRAVVHDSGLITTHYQPQQPPPPVNHHIYPQISNVNPLFFSSSPQLQLLNLDSVVWSKTLPSFSDHHFFPPSSQPTIPTVPFSPLTTATTSKNPPPPARNPKKRSRASRRAPTTVLTTDTYNFRAMVQEFTGIPAPQFTSSSPAFPSLTTSFDLFGRPPAMMRSNTNNFDNLPQLPFYLLPQKLQFSPSSSFSDSCSLLNTMHNPITFLSNSLNQSPYLDPKTTESRVSLNRFGAIGQTLIHEHHTILPDLDSTAGTPTTTSTKKDDQMVSGNWNGASGANYTNGKESSGVKDDQGFIEPWICSSD